jgi:EAL domain-containing protein (putative c-di-GMP-specific phosphodiesterase class I)
VTSAHQVDLQRAVAEDQLVLHYQPVVGLADSEVRGVEALIRWQHPVGGLLLPDDFIPAAAATPAMADITRWVLRTACAAAARWSTWDVSVNVTARDIATDTFVTDVTDALDAAGLPCERLTLELTETAFVQDLPRAAAALGHLRARGVGVALDDFGTGYSSMLYLRDLPLTSVKIDRVFVGGLLQAGDDLAIVSSLLTLAQRVGLTAVAEGVETEAQAQLLRSWGCPLGQGFLWSHPLCQQDADAAHRDGLQNDGGAPRIRHRTRPVEAHLAERAHSLLSEGASLHTIAAALNAAGERTRSGNRWHAASVARLIRKTSPAGHDA